MYLANKSSTELQCLLFDKLLKVSPSSMKERAEMGQITNFLENDAFKITFLMMTSPDIITIPARIIGYCLMLFKFFGFCFIFGIGTFLCFMSVNVYFMRKFKNLHKKQMILKDKRMKVISETFDNIKIIKLYAWEEEFINKIGEARENELQNRIEIFNSQNLNSTIQWFSPVATSVVSIGAYQYYHDVLKIEDIMVSLNLFNAIQGPIKMIPGLINNFNEVIISTNRIQKYLLQDEINPANIIKNDKNMTDNDLSVKIVDGNYSWGMPPTTMEEITWQDLKRRGITFDKPKKMFKKEDKKKKELPSIELSTKVSSSDTDSSGKETDDSSISMSSFFCCVKKSLNFFDNFRKKYSKN
jgi:ABC-type multidrug transport system fused ATPase/permease subunit